MRQLHSKRYPITSQTSSLADLRLVGEQLKQLQGKILSQNLCSLLPIDQEKVIAYLTRCTSLAQQVQKIKARLKEANEPKRGDVPLFKKVFGASSKKFSLDPQKVAALLLDEAFQIGESLINMRSTLLSTTAFNYFIYLCQLTDRFGESKNVLNRMSQKKIFPDLSTYRSLLKSCLVFEEARQIDVYFTLARSYFKKLHLRQVGLNSAVDGLAGIWAYFLHFSFLQPGMSTLSAYATLCGMFITFRFAGKLALKNYSPYHTAFKTFSTFWALGISFPENTTQDSMNALYNQVLLDCIAMGKLHIFRELSLREFELGVSIESGFAEKAAEIFIKRGELDLAITWIKRVPEKPSPTTLFYLTKKLHEQERFSDVVEIWENYDLGVFSNPPFAIDAYARLGRFYSAFQLSKHSTLENNGHAFASENFRQGLRFLESFYFHSYSDQLLASGSTDPRLFVWAIEANRYSDLNPITRVYAQSSVERILSLLNLYSHAFPDYSSSPHVEVFIEAINSLNSHKRYAVSLGIYYSTIKPYLQASLKKGSLFSRPQVLNQIRKALFSAIVAGCYLATARGNPKTPRVDSNSCCHEICLKENTSQGSQAFSALLQILEDYKSTLRPLEILPPSVISLVKRAHPSISLSPDTTAVHSGSSGRASQLGLQSLLGRLHHISSKSNQGPPKK